MHIESRSSQRSPGEYEFIIEFDTNAGNVGDAMDALRESCNYMKVISRNYKDNLGKNWYENMEGNSSSAVL